MQLLALLSTFVLSVVAFDNSRFDNLAVYWGQNSYGAISTHTDPSKFQQRLSFYCQDDTIDVLPLAFLNVFFGPGGAPSINLANTCNPVDNATFPGTNLPDCSSMASDIKTCQSKGKLVTLSLGGATGSVGFGSDSQAQDFAQTVWDLFFGGSSDMRPFGDAILDGVDLDIEGGGSSGYVAFLTKLQSLSGSKKLYVTAAPQCVFPDASLSGVLNAFPFDAVYVQFYNNPCGLTHFSEANNWDFGLWDDWARHTSPNPNVKIYIGAPADSTSAGSGYVPPDTLASIAKSMRTSFPSFGGSMLWDSSSAFANNRYDLAIKTAMRAAGGTGFTFPACSAPAFVPGNNYPGGSTVSFGGYIWQSKWFSNAQPSNSPFGDWSAISACSGNGGSATSTTTAPPSGPTAGSCSNVAAWSSSTIYSTPGTEVTFNGHLYTNNWWTQGDSPTGQSGAWTDKGACTSSRLRNSRFFRL